MIKHLLLYTLIISLLLATGSVFGATTTDDRSLEPEIESSSADAGTVDTSVSMQPPVKTSLFIHDTSANMRKRRRISLMQTSIRTVLDYLAPGSYAGLRAYGHRFPEDGPDACDDTELSVYPGPILTNREDIGVQLNFLSDPVIGGGAPVGLALQHGLADLKKIEGNKDVYLYLVDLMKCDSPNPIEVIRSACEIEDLHLTLIGFGLKSDLQILEDQRVPQLGCVDIVNLVTNEDNDVLSDRLLTRLSLEFRNADGQLVDPLSAKTVAFDLSQYDPNNTLKSVRLKEKAPSMKGSSIDTVGLDAGTYFLDLTYHGQKLRAQYPIELVSRKTTQEVIQLGRMFVEVTDSHGALLEDAENRQVQIVVKDAGVPIRTATHVSHAAFDLLPANRYTVQVSYSVDGDVLSTEYEQPVTIEEGNHKYVTIALPLGAIRGKVLDMDQQPAQGVEVLLTRSQEDDSAPGLEQSLLTAQDGTYFFSELEAGDYTVHLQKEGHRIEQMQTSVVGGHVTMLEEVSLFHGIDIVVTGVSGSVVTDAEVRLIDHATSIEYPVEQNDQSYRNAAFLSEGEYRISIKKDGYEPASQTIAITDMDRALDLTFTLPYYISVHGTVINGREDPLAEAVLEFHNQHSAFLPGRTVQSVPPGTTRVPQSVQSLTQPDGTFKATLLVKEPGQEKVSIAWQDMYGQIYRKDLEFSLPGTPQTVDLEYIRLPINFLRLTIMDVTGNGMSVDSVILSHQQSGQSGIEMTEVETGEYESTAMLDGDYTFRIINGGYQDAEQHVQLAGGMLKDIPVTLQHYVTVSGTVINGKNSRVVGATVTFAGVYSDLTSSQPIVTGKDGRFQTTLLVKKAATEPFEVQWTSPDGGRNYRLAAEVRLPAVSNTEFAPLYLGEYQLPINFVTVNIQDVSAKGLREADVLFITEQGEQIAAHDLGDGFYESPDLPDGQYDITINKPGYQENILISNVTVGQSTRISRIGPIAIPHYITVTGTLLNGKGEGVANAEMTFGNTHSEQLEECRTNYQGHFQTTVLVLGSVEETWKAFWRRPEYSASGTFQLPGHPEDTVNLGEIRLPINFISLPVEDIYHRPLPGATLRMTHINEAPIRAAELTLEELQAGMYQAQYVPDGTYVFTLEKKGYEVEKQIRVSVRGGVHKNMAPVALGHYVVINGTTVNGKNEPVGGAQITFSEHASTLIPQEPEEYTLDQETGEVSSFPDVRPSTVAPIVMTNDRGSFSSTVLVRSSQREQLVVSWDQRYSASFPLDFIQTPGIQEVELHLPINFLQVHVQDVSGQLLSGASVVFTHQQDKVIFSAHEGPGGLYESPEGLPDGTYSVLVKNDRYEQQTSTLQLQGGEVKHTAYQLRHYVTIRGHVINGKRDDVAAATIKFDHLKSSAQSKIISGADGLFETDLLVQEIGRERGEITWIGAHTTYTKSFWIDLPMTPTVIDLPEEATRLPVNFISLEVKSVAATGIPAATVMFTHRETGQIIEARDLDKGNYEGVELPNGTYDISITKENYQDLLLENIAVKEGEHRIGIPVPKFLHYITISGVVLNGKQEGVSQATVEVKSPTRVQDCDPVASREDGSFTLYALVTDIGSEPLDITWNDIYTISVPVSLPPFPEHMQLNPITLPINFIVLSLQNVFHEPLSGASVTFLKQDQEQRGVSVLSQPSTFSATELSNGRYESPELPDGTYMLMMSKQGYSQNTFEHVSVQAGETVANMTLTLPHIVTVQGMIIDGRQQVIPDAEVYFGNTNSTQSSEQVVTDKTGYFTEDLLVTGTGQETLTVVVSGSPYTHTPDEQFTFTQTFRIMIEPGKQDVQTLRLPINYIPIRVQDVSGQAIPDADVTVTWTSAAEGASDTGSLETPDSGEGELTDRLLPHRYVRHLGEGRYEGFHLKDGRYVVSVSKNGYESQTRSVSVTSGEVAPDTVFVLPHYVTVSGFVTNGKGDGVADALLEFDTQNSTLTEYPAEIRGTEAQTASQLTLPKPRITTDALGHFSATLLIKKTGLQRVRVVWQERYVRQMSFQLPQYPVHYPLENEIRLPINFVPVRVTNVLGEGLAGATILLKKSGTTDEESIPLHSLGNGFYATREIPDGVYTMTVSKDGYQEAVETISVQGGEQASEQSFSLPHFVTVRGMVVNGKGSGVSGSNVSLTGLSSQFIEPDTAITTQPDGSFEMELLVTGTENPDLREHIEISWKDQSRPFGIAEDFQLPPVPGYYNLGILTLPANFASVSVQDFSGKGLADVSVTFIDEKGKTFVAGELANGLYEGQNLPDGVYTLKVSKAGYRESYQADIIIGDSPQAIAHVMFQLPYYVTLEGVVVDGKGRTLTSDVNLKLEEMQSQLVPESVMLQPDGRFNVQLLVDTPGKEHLQATYVGEYGLHTKRVAFVLPSEPGTVDLQRVTLPINFVPIEIKDLLGYGIEGATVILHHLEERKEIPAREQGNGVYEGEQLLDGTYKIVITKEGYKSVESPVFWVNDGIITETKSFNLPHYAWITGFVTNGEGGGVRDPLLSFEHFRSQETRITTSSNGTFEVELEVQEVGNEKLYADWKNMYRTPIIFKLPSVPERKNLGEIRLPVNFLSIVVTDISGSTLADVNVNVEDASGSVVQTLKTDQNGSCKTSDLPNGTYRVSANKPGYTLERRDVYVSDGNLRMVKFTLPHYVIVKGQVKDITQKPVEKVNIIFEEFTDTEGQKLRTATDAAGEFEQQLLIDDPKFLEWQRGHFQMKKGGIDQTFTFRISTEPNQVSQYTTLLFPSRYLVGKVVEAEVNTIPIADANISFSLTSKQTQLAGLGSTSVFTTPDTQPTLRFTTDALGVFEAGDLVEGDYKVTIRKEGYVEYEDFVKISGLLQEKEFRLYKGSR